MPSRISLSLALGIVLPTHLGSVDIFGLALLRTACKQYNQRSAGLAEIDAVTRAKIDFVFRYPGTNGFDVRPIALCDTRQRRCDLCRGGRIQSIEPGAEWAAASGVEIFGNLHSHNSNIYGTNCKL